MPSGQSLMIILFVLCW